MSAAIQAVWLGQAGFVLDFGSLRIVIDPFLSPHPSRLHAAPAIEELGRIDWLLSTHAHVDHLDIDALPELMRHSPGLRAVVTEAGAAALAAAHLDLEHVVVYPGEQHDLGSGISIDVIPAWHADDPTEGYEADPNRFLGYRVVSEELVVYHSGDTLLTEELHSSLRGKRVDVALLPINGRDSMRDALGIAGNLDAREAAALAKHVRAKIFVPMHWDMFAGNTVPPGSAVEAMADTEASIHTFVLARNQPFVLAT